MTKTRFILKESAKTIYRHPGVALGSLLSLTLIFLLFNIFWVAALSTDQFYDTMIQQLRMEIFVSETVPDSALTNLSQTIASLDGVKEMRYISKDEARQELSRLIGIDLLVGYDSLNPLPRSYILTMQPEALTVAEMQRIEQSVVSMQGVEDVLYSRDWLAKAEQTRKAVSTVGFAVGVLILLTAVITSSNSIRLMTRARGFGFHQMLLLGAGRLFVAAPFLVEGFVIAGLSALLGWVVVWYSHGEIQFSQFPILLPTARQITLFCASAAALGAISGLLGVRKILK